VGIARLREPEDAFTIQDMVERGKELLAKLAFVFPATHSPQSTASPASRSRSHTPTHSLSARGRWSSPTYNSGASRLPADQLQVGDRLAFQEGREAEGPGVGGRGFLRGEVLARPPPSPAPCCYPSSCERGNPVSLLSLELFREGRSHQHPKGQLV
jgi:hypothetical protein